MDRRFLLGIGDTRLLVWRINGMDSSDIRARCDYWHSRMDSQTKIRVSSLKQYIPVASHRVAEPKDDRVASVLLGPVTIERVFIQVADIRCTA